MAQDDKVWWVDEGRLCVAVDNGDGTFSALTGATQILAYCNKIPSDLGADVGPASDEGVVPAPFINAVLYRVIAEGYELPGGNVDKAMYFDHKYASYLRAAKDYASNEGVTGPRTALNHSIF
jgi:hypothetical protein